jgi:hypothetical protein
MHTKFCLEAIEERDRLENIHVSEDNIKINLKKKDGEGEGRWGGFGSIRIERNGGLL